MPLYEYDCEDCGERFETLVSAGAKDAPKKCPACGSEATTRALSTFAVGTSTRKSDACATCCPGGTCNL